MKRKFSISFILMLLIFCSSHFTYGQSYTTSTTVTAAIKLGTTQPISYLISKKPTSKLKKDYWKAINRPPKDMKNRGKRNVVHPELEHQGPDLISQYRYSQKKLNQQVDLLVNQDGIGIGSPNDPTGDIGINYYLQAVNSTLIGVFEKNGNKYAEFSANTLWAPLNESSAGDPIIIFDQDAAKWIITEFPFSNQLLIAISKTSDPLGEYDVYKFGTPNFPDYPKYGLWNDAITVTTNEEGSNKLHLYAINKEDLYNGVEEVKIQRIEVSGALEVESGFLVSTPVDWTGAQAPPENTGPYFVNLDDSSWGNGAIQDQINLYELHVDWDEPTNTSVDRTDIVTSPFDSYPCKDTGFGFSCIPQPETDGLDGLPDVIMFQPHYRRFSTHETMIMSFITDITDGENLAGIRWVELRRTEIADEWDLYQEGTYAINADIDSLHRFMPSICMDGAGNIALAYSVANENTYAGLRMTGRFNDDPLGEMTILETTIVDGITDVQSGGRYGDYAQLTIDPTNDVQFWFTSEYAGDSESHNSRTRIASFILEKKDYDLAASTITSPSSILPKNSTNIPIEFDIANLGNFLVDTLTLSFAFNGDTISEIVHDTIFPSSVYTYIFNDSIDFLDIGDYQISCWVDAINDSTTYNNESFKNIQVIERNDLFVKKLKTTANSLNICGDSTLFLFNVQNLGYDTLTHFDYRLEVDNQEISSQEWNGFLSYGEEIQLSIILSNVSNGEQKVRIVCTNPNYTQDANFDNNSVEITPNFLNNSDNSYINIALDQYGEETSWTIEDLEGNIIYSGENYISYSNVSIPVCLAYGECYVFTIYDTYGDGIIAPGYYEVTNSAGDVIVSQKQTDFGTSETTNFCPHGGCNVDFVMTSTPAGEDNDAGIIVVEVTSGIAPFEYSIDGGANFQSLNIFENLEEGEYEVTVRDAGNCYETQSINITLVVNSEVENYSSVEILPNPTDGYFKIIITGADYGYILPYYVIDSKGTQIGSNYINKYNDTYEGPLNLRSFANGVYYIIFKNTDIPPARVIKQ